MPHMVLGGLDAEKWRASVVVLANNSQQFADAARWFDGSIVVTVGPVSQWFKIYSGRVIDAVLGRGVMGFDFEISGSEDDWLKALRAPRLDFQRRLADRSFSVSGDLLEFMRIARAVDIFASILQVAYQEQRTLVEDAK
jgi:hypothetical protein